MNRIEFGDCRAIMRRWAAEGVRVQTCITSPPYFGLRDYGHDDQLGLEATPDEFIANLVDVFRCVRDLLADDGTLWVNIGDSYAGSGRGGNSDAISGEGRDASMVPHSQRKNCPRAPRAGYHATQVDAGAIGRAWVPPPVGLKNKDLIGIPWMLAFALRADGWYLRQEIIWSKAESGDAREGRCMPESITDRCTKAHEQIFLLAKSRRYHFDAEAIKEPAQNWGKARDRTAMRGGTADPKLKHGGLSKADHVMGNRRSVWRVNPAGFKGAHFATFPPKLIEPCVLAGARRDDIVLDPFMGFMGSGTTAMVAALNGRRYMGCELNPEYATLQEQRLHTDFA